MTDFTVVDIETAPSAHGLAVPADADERAGIRTPWEEKCSLNPRLGRVVAVGHKNGAGAVVHAGDDERGMIAFVLEVIGKAMAETKVVTFNGLGFDVPFLHVRAAVHGLEVPYYAPSVLKKYDTKYHADLSAILQNWSMPEKGDSLPNWCRAFGIAVTDTTSGAVAKPNSSAPSSAATITSRPVFICPSTWTTMRSHSSSKLTYPEG